MSARRQARQDKELEQMMAFEIKMGELQRERDAAAELQARKDEAKRREGARRAETRRR